MRRRCIMGALAGIAALGLVVPPALAARSQSHNGGGKDNPWAVNVTALCGYVMTAKMDPILYPGVPAGPDNPSHMHQFFANDHISRDGTETPVNRLPRTSPHRMNKHS